MALTLSEFGGYFGQYPCTKCGSLKTGTNTMATSDYYMDFHCHDCGVIFKKKSSNVSPLSKHLQRFARLSTDIFE
jgi:transcription elongation factor Elf1